MLVESMKEKHEADFRRYCDDAMKNLVSVCDTIVDDDMYSTSPELAIMDVTEYAYSQQRAIKKEYYYHENIMGDTPLDVLYDTYAEAIRRVRSYTYTIIHRVMYRHADNVLKDALNIEF